MKAILSLDGIGHFSGRYWGYGAGCAGEIAHYKAPFFASQILTDPSYLGRIIIVDVNIIHNRWPMPEECQSFIPHLAGLVLLGRVTEPAGAGEHFTLRNYLDTNRIPAFIPDNPELLRNAIENSKGIIASMNRAGFNGRHIHTHIDFRAISSPQEYIWDLAPGEMPEESIGLVVCDYGVNYGLLRSLKKTGAKLRVVPPDTEPERVIALHPDGVVIAGGPYPADIGMALSMIERIIGIRPVLAVGNGALMTARALGMAVEALEHPHYGAAIMANDLSNGIIETYQAHAYAPSPAALQKAGCRITHVNAADGSVEGFACGDYDIVATMFTMTSETLPRTLSQFMAGLKKEPVS